MTHETRFWWYFCLIIFAWLAFTWKIWHASASSLLECMSCIFCGRPGGVTLYINVQCTVVCMGGLKTGQTQLCWWLVHPNYHGRTVVSLVQYYCRSISIRHVLLVQDGKRCAQEIRGKLVWQVSLWAHPVSQSDVQEKLRLIQSQG